MLELLQFGCYVNDHDALLAIHMASWILLPVCALIAFHADMGCCIACWTGAICQKVMIAGVLVKCVKECSNMFPEYKVHVLLL